MAKKSAGLMLAVWASESRRFVKIFIAVVAARMKTISVIKIAIPPPKGIVVL